MKRFISIGVTVLSSVSIILSSVYAEASHGTDGSVKSTVVEKHVWSEGVIDCYPTCSENGKISYKCQTCDTMRTEIIASGEAYHVYDNDCDPVCNVCGAQREVSHIAGAAIHRDGTRHYRICTVCGEKIDPEEHKFGAVGEDGTSVCEVCGYATSTSETHKHKLVAVEETAPTCTEPGNKKYYICTGCSGIFSDSKGKKEIKDPDSVVIAPDGHTPVSLPGYVPTCTAEGLSDAVVCSKCETVILSSKKIPVISHIFSADYSDNSHFIKCEYCRFTANTEPHDIKLDLADSDSFAISCDECGYSGFLKIQELKNGNEIIINIPVAYGVDDYSVEITLPVLSKLNDMMSNTKSGISKVRISFGEGSVLLDKYMLSNFSYGDDELTYEIGYSIVGKENDLLSGSQRDTLEGLPENTEIVSAVFSCKKLSNSTNIVTNSTVCFPYELPEGWKNSEISVYCLNTDGELTEKNCKYDGKTLSFLTDGSGIYVITKSQNTTKAVDQNSRFIRRIVITANVVVISALLVVAVIIIKRRIAEANSYYDE